MIQKLPRETQTAGTVQKSVFIFIYQQMLVNADSVYSCTHAVFMYTKLIHLSAFEQWWASTVHKLLAQRKSSEYFCAPVRVKLGQISSIAMMLHSFEAQWAKCEGQKKRPNRITFHWIKTPGRTGKRGILRNPTLPQCSVSRPFSSLHLFCVCAVRDRVVLNSTLKTFK